MKPVSISVLCIMLHSTMPAAAGISEANSCSATLPAQARLIYRETLPQLKPGVNARQIVRTTVISMVQAGKISRDRARANAEAAGECLKKLTD